ncbi:MAG: SulP family inorganic anion transporter [Flavobacteriaceae bacterium]|nr:SulP family inorganic anion transporter [Flavobacteriaceae bacterium]MCY4266754.1 SulP family inorganic anion transporter [Flavobacteriaceae bacterium]
MKLSFTDFRGDLFGGLTAGIVALPLALAFGVSSGLGPSAGLYGAIVISFLAALFGGTPTQISGPTAPMTALSMVIVASILAANNGVIEQALPLILMVFVLAGVIQILFGLVGFGKYIKYIPYPVISGFMTAIGVIILITQIQPILGYYVKDDTQYIESLIPLAEEQILEEIILEEAQRGILVLEDFTETIENAGKISRDQIENQAQSIASKNSSGVIGTINSLSRAIQSISWIEMILAFSTIFIIYGFKRITNAVPSTLVALIVVSAVAYLLQSNGIVQYAPIQRIPEGFPKFNIDIFGQINYLDLLPYVAMAITLAFLGAIDSLLTSVIADNLTKTKHQSNRELVGQGIGNSVAAVFGGIPGAGATIRTVVNIQSGGKTKLSGIMSSLVLIVILLALGPVASEIPAAVLAGILVTVGIGVMDFKGLKAVMKIPRTEVTIMVIVLVLSVFWNLVYAVGIGLVLASIFFMKKMGDVSKRYSRVGTILKEKAWKDEKGIDKKILETVFIKHLDGPLFFGFTSDFMNLIHQLPKTCKVVIFRMSRVPYIDQSGLYAMEEVLMELSQKEIKYVFVDLQPQPRLLMQSIGIVPTLVSSKHIFRNFQNCKKWLIQEITHKKQLKS